jgi:hypothetical protein
MEIKRVQLVQMQAKLSGFFFALSLGIVIKDMM